MRAPKLILILSVSLVGCSRFEMKEADLSSLQGGVSGATLYAQNCASCHGALNQSTKQGRTASEIEVALDGIPQMSSLQFLSSSEISAIATALGGQGTTIGTQPTPTPLPPLPSSAQALYSPAAFGVAPMRPLTNDEISSSLELVFGVKPTAGQMADLPGDLSSIDISPFDNIAAMKSASPLLIQSLNSFAEAYSKSVLTTVGHISSKASCTPSGANDETCFSKYINAVAPLMLRRPISAAETSKILSTLMSFAIEEGRFESSVEMLIQYLVQSPEFLYRVEPSLSAKAGGVQLNSYQVATRIAYLVWGAGPDAKLMAAAANGNLSTASGRRSEALRMFADARSKQQWRKFHSQWLNLTEVGLPSQLAPSMVNETNALLDTLVVDESTPWFRLFTAKESYVTPALANHYGLTAPTTQAAWVTYPSQRGGGILSHATFLAQGAKFGDTSPTVRGYQVLKRVLCTRLGPLPTGVDTSIAPGAPTSCKPQRYNMRTMTNCSSCHSQTDSIGFGLENLSPFGQWRVNEPVNQSCQIDGQGQIQGLNFTGPQDLGNSLGQMPEVSACATRQLLRFALGRAESATDDETLRALRFQFNESPNLKSLVLSLVESEGIRFLYR